MRIQKYGISLRTIQRDDLELIRTWRNDPFVQKTMLFQETISSEDQQSWFENLGNSNVYFLLTVEEKKVGVLHVKSIDWEKRSGEAGVFIGDPGYRNSNVPMLAICAMMDLFLGVFAFNSLQATVRKDQPETLEFNQQLGYEIIREDALSYQLEVTNEKYQKGTSGLRKFLDRISATNHFELTKEEQSLFLP